MAEMNDTEVHITESKRKQKFNLRKILKNKTKDSEVEPVSTWIKLIATFMINICVATADSVFGIFYDHFIDKYDSNRASVGWVLSAFAAAGSLSGVFISPFVVMYGCRSVAVASLFLMALGMCLASVAPNLPCLVVFYGVMHGCGWGGLYLASSTIIQQCFTTNRGLATGISSLGFTAGTISSPILVEFLLRRYALSGALLITGTVYAQGLVFAMLMKSPKHLIQNTKNTQQNGIDKDLPKEMEIEVFDEIESTKHTDTDNGIPEDHSPSESNTSLEAKKSKNNIIQLMKNMIDFSVFKEITFVLSIVYFSALWMSRYITLSQVIGAAIYKGISPKDSAYLITIMGFCNMFIRIFSTVILNCSWMNPVLYTGVGTLFVVVSSLLIAISQTYLIFVCSMVCMGFSEGIAVTVMPMVLVHIVGVARFARAWSMVWVGILPWLMLVGPFSGWLVDITGNYISAFIMSASLGAIASIVALIIHLLIKLKERKHKDPENESDTENQKLNERTHKDPANESDPENHKLNERKHKDPENESDPESHKIN